MAPSKEVPQEVRRLVIRHPLLNQPKPIDLPWDFLPETIKEELRQLDVNHDGTIVYTPVPGGVLSSEEPPPAGEIPDSYRNTESPYLPVEVHHGNRSASRLGSCGHSGTRQISKNGIMRGRKGLYGGGGRSVGPVRAVFVSV